MTEKESNMAFNIINQLDRINACVSVLQGLSVLSVQSNESLSHSLNFVVEELEKGVAVFVSKFQFVLSDRDKYGLPS